MAIYLVVLSGSKLGLKVRIADGLTIGRKSGDLILDDDAKVSGTHAKVGLDNKGQFVLNDLGSSNALVIDKRKTRKVALLPGVTFRVGNTQFRVVKDEKEEKYEETEMNFRVLNPKEEAESEKKVDEDSETKVPIEIAAKPAVPKTWREGIVEFLEQNEKMVSSATEEVILGAFSPPMILDFIEGVQAETKITLGYGPREAGFNHLDIDLTDPKVPERAFMLAPGPGSVEIKDLSGGKLLVNNRLTEVTFLEEGDIITIGQTKIKVRYL